MGGTDNPGGHAFISYVREDSREVDRLQGVLESAGIRVWRDTVDLWPGEDWRARIRQAITGNALVFIACFSHNSAARAKSYQNQELALAVDQLVLRQPDMPWLIPVRFDDCTIPNLDLGGGRMLTSIQAADLFGERYDHAASRLVRSVLQILGSRYGAFSTAGTSTPDSVTTGISAPPDGAVQGSSVARLAQESVGDRVYLVRGKDGGRPAWHYVMIDPLKLEVFKQNLATRSLDVSDYGVILYSGWGEDPPDQIVETIRETYSAD